MDKDTLSPLLGRLIDAAKAAAAEVTVSGAAGTEAGETLRATAPAVATCVDGAALMTESEYLFSGHRGPSGECAVASALDAWRSDGGAEIVAACVARVDAAADVLPCADCRQALAGLSPYLPVVLKLKGRWVLTHLADVDQEETGA